MHYLLYLFDFILHIDVHLDAITQNYGTLTYLILFLIVFCETGLVVMPLLPGDSLLFAAGAIAARGNIDVNAVAAVIFVAAVLGDAVNYAVGAYVGPRVFQKKDSRIFKQAYIERTQAFFNKYGGKAIIFARFVPVVRTFAPFLAGVGTMSYAKFAAYNIAGALAWVGLFVYGGYMFGETPLVKKNFTLVIIAIIIVSVLPAVFNIWQARRQPKPSM
jgi:membrane-associated protein